MLPMEELKTYWPVICAADDERAPPAAWAVGAELPPPAESSLLLASAVLFCQMESTMFPIVDWPLNDERAPPRASAAEENVTLSEPVVLLCATASAALLFQVVVLRSWMDDVDLLHDESAPP